MFTSPSHCTHVKKILRHYAIIIHRYVKLQEIITVTISTTKHIGSSPQVSIIIASTITAVNITVVNITAVNITVGTF